MIDRIKKSVKMVVAGVLHDLRSNPNLTLKDVIACQREDGF